MIDSYLVDMFLRVVSICLLLAGTHGYLGLHVLARQVIFVDLAMAQMAALGATCALVLGYDPIHHPADAPVAYLFSLGFTLAGAGVFAATRMRRERIPQEAIIGIVYATAAALVVLILSRSATGGEQIRHMLVGNVLNVDWPTVGKTAAIYAAIGAFHWWFRKPFLQISFAPEEAARTGLRVRLWDFFFYASLGVVITSSVAIAGVLLVFSFLVVPAAIGLLLADSVRGRLVVGWIAGAGVTICGALLSFFADVPAGPTVVAVFALSLLLAGTGKFLARRPPLREIGTRLVLPAAALAVLAWFVLGPGATGSRHVHLQGHGRIAEILRGGNEAQILEALRHLATDPDPSLADDITALTLESPSPRIREHAVRALLALPHPRVTATLERLARSPAVDPYLKLEIARVLAERGVQAGLRLLLEILESDAPRLARAQAVSELRRLTGKHFGYDPARSGADNRDAVARWRRFLEESASGGSAVSATPVGARSRPKG